MVEYMFVKDTITGETLQIVKPSSEREYIVTMDTSDPVVVKEASIRKVIRTWMKGKRCS